MTIAEQFGVRAGTCWCCGGLGLCLDDWDAVERCMFCSGVAEGAQAERATDEGNDG